MIRIAQTEDADAIAYVHVASWQSVYRGHLPSSYLDKLSLSERSASWMNAINTHPGQTAVFVEGARVVGFVHVCPTRDDNLPPDTGEVAAIYLDPSRWRRGIGTELMNWAVWYAKGQQWNQLMLWVLEGNNRARAFYEGGGWQSDGARKKDTIGGQQIVEVRYWRELDA